MRPEDQKIIDTFKEYSFDDVVSSIFIFNIWVPNVGSGIKPQYWYRILESLSLAEFQKENQIKNYDDFKKFLEVALSLLPSFAMLEDYVPESDWGEIRYYFNKSFYKIFYGGDLSNPYDFYYSFEIIHRPYLDFYIKIFQRSPLDELEFLLKLNDSLIENIHQSSSDEGFGTGHAEIPPLNFWESVRSFLINFEPQSYLDGSILAHYSRNWDNVQPVELDLNHFMDDAFSGLNCRYLFIKGLGKIYPILPRKNFSVLYDVWGQLLKEHYDELLKENPNPQTGTGVEMVKFARERLDESEHFHFVSAVNKKGKPGNATFALAVKSKDKLFLFNVVQPVFEKFCSSKYLNEMNSTLTEANKLLSVTPTRLLLWADKKILEFRSKELKVLSPYIITVFPSPITSNLISIPIPKNFTGHIMGLDQALGILDEIHDTDELSDFFDYLDGVKKYGIPPIASYLDKFGSFRDSHSVIVPGALDPNMMMIDLNWGTGIRYRSLTKFWKQFPETNFFGHPRSWEFPEEDKSDTGLILKSKIFFGYAYYQKIGEASFFINAPAHLMTFQQGKINDLLLQSLADGLEICKSIVEKLKFCHSRNNIQAMLFPASIVRDKSELKHLVHLLPTNSEWETDIARIGPKDYGVRLVYDDDKVMTAFRDAKDRSPQIRLLHDILFQINAHWDDDNCDSIETELMAESPKKARFTIYSIEKRISFPEASHAIFPEKKDLKLADKQIALIAHRLKIEPGTFSLEDAKSKLKQLIDGLVGVINAKVNTFSLKPAIGFLIENVDGITNEYEFRNTQVKMSLEHEVTYQREEKANADRTKFFRQHKNYRYVIEKFAQLRPIGNKHFGTDELKELLGLADRLLDLYAASDMVLYGIYPAEVQIDSDYIATVVYKTDLARMEAEYGEEQAKINLGLIGNKEDVPDLHTDISVYLDQLDIAFKKDLNFGLKNFVNVQQVLSSWTYQQNNIPETTHYSATMEEIQRICSASIRDFNPSETQAILDFLTLTPENLLQIEDDPAPASDLPVWEYRKRAARYNLRPLIKIEEKYHWGAHSLDRSGRIWMNISETLKLPADIKAPTLSSILKSGHDDFERRIVDKIEEIARRHTSFVKTNLFFHKIDKQVTDIGDSDVFVFLKDKRLILNIESKIIDPAFCLKDIKRVREKIFGHKKEDGSFQKGYLQKAETRAGYVNAHALDLVRKLGWDSSPKPINVVSLFVTQISFWWTKFPPEVSDIKFVEIKLLDDYIKSLTA